VLRDPSSWLRDGPLAPWRGDVLPALADLTTLDLVLGGALLLAALGGLRTGLVARVATWAGFVVGLVAAGRTVPYVLARVDPLLLPLRTFLAVLTLGATLTVVTVAVTAASAPLRALFRVGPLSVIDRALGAAAGALAAILVAWIALPSAAAVPGRVATEVRASALLGALDAATPTPPDIGRSLRTLLGGDRFPEVFSALAPTTATAPPPGTTGLDATVLERAIAASTWVGVAGCGRQYHGSGFAVDADHVVTNAHVVAGARTITIRTGEGGTREADVVAFDPEADLALLAAPGHGLLPLDLGRPGEGQVGAVIGYPGGQREPRIAPARVDRQVLGVGRDIYGAGSATRELVILAAELRGGDSGAAVVDRDGLVIAVVFAVSLDVPTIAYGLDPTTVADLLARPRRLGDAGRCI